MCNNGIEQQIISVFTWKILWKEGKDQLSHGRYTYIFNKEKGATCHP